jgi:hypothetical protein
MAMTVTLTAHDAARTSLTLIDASSSPWKLVTANWGNAVWDTAYTGPRRSLGARPASSSAQNRQVALGLRLLPASVTAGVTAQKELNAVVEVMRRNGGRVTVQHTGQTLRQHLEVLTGTSALQDWTNRAEWAGRVDYALTFTAEPYVRGDSMEVLDTFTSDTRDDYTFDTGAKADVSVSSGELVPASAGTSVAMIHTAVGYQYGDVRATATFNVGATVTNYLGGVILKRTAAGTYLRVYVDDNGTNSRLRIDKVVSSTPTNLASVNLAARVAATTPFAVAGSIEGNTVRAEHYTVPRNASMRSSPTTTTSVVLTGSDKTAFGDQVTGQCGLRWTPQATGARATHLTIEPFPMTAPGGAGTRRITGTIPGDAPALLDVIVGNMTSGRFGAWCAERVEPRNMVLGGDFEEKAGFATDGPWFAGSVLTGAGTVGNVNAGARTGAYHLDWTTGAAANRGIETWLVGPFIAGRSYTASAWVRSASDTENVRLLLGTATDSAGGTASALSSTWTERTVTWTPTADTPYAVLAVESTSATAVGAGELDTVRVYDTMEPPTAVSQLRGLGGAPLHGVLHPGQVDQGSSNLVTGLSGWPYIFGSAQRGATGSLTCVWMIDPSIMRADDHAQSIDVEVWAGFVVGARTGVAAVLSADVGGATIYSREYGSSGCRLLASATNVYRLGTVGFAADLDRRGSAGVNLQVAVTSTGGSGNIDLAWVILMRAHNRVAWPTGKSTSGYPSFNNGSPTVTRAMHDGRCLQDSGSRAGWRTAPGHGQVATIDPDATHFTWITAASVPNGDAGSTTNPDPQLIRLSPTPRWHQLRDE